MSIFSRLFSKKLDSVTAEELTDTLILADIAPDLAMEITSKLRQSSDPKSVLRAELLKHATKLTPHSTLNLGVAPAKTDHIPHSILIVGVNGAGKTTTIGKLAAQTGNTIIGACDTFRAAANEQLDIWAKRAGAEIIHGTEPAAVAYKTMELASNYAKATSDKNGRTVILDTAGRLGNNTDLMNELSKIVRVIKKLDPNAPNETWLVLDGTTGQNALNQIDTFNAAAPLTGLIVTKMDSTSRAGFLISYAAKTKNPLPVRYIGYGEKITDLRPFSAEEYIDKLIGNS